MNNGVKNVIKSLLIVLIVCIAIVLGGYLLIITSVNSKVESVQSQIVKSVSDNNYMTKDTYETLLDIFEKFVKSTASDESAVVRVENGVVNTANGSSPLDDLVVGIYINYTDDLGTGDKLSVVKSQGDLRSVRVRLDFRQVQIIKFGTVISDVNVSKNNRIYSVYFDNPATCLRYIK